MKKILSPLMKCTALLATSLALHYTSLAQTTTTWIGPASGGEWNTAANWSTLLAPADATTNAVIGNTTNVNYNVPMTAATFGTLTTRGVLNVNAAGFNNTGIFMTLPGGGAKLFVNNGGAVNVTGNLGFSSNAIVSLSTGGSVAVSGTLIVGCGTSGATASTTVGSFGAMTNNGGILTAANTSLNPGNASVTTSDLLVINGGTNSLGNVSIKRSNAGSGGYSTLGSEGLIINNGQVTMSSLNVGGTGGNSFLTAMIAGGIVTNTGAVTINQGTSARGSRLLQTGGLFVVPDPSLVNPNPTVAGSLNVYSVTGGTNLVGGFSFGNASAGAGTVNFTNAATIYVGSQGIVSNGVVLVTAALNSGGLFGASASWVGSAAMKLNGGTFTFQAADLSGSANNISLSGALSGTGNLNKTGGGTLLLSAANTYSGNTLLNGGTLAVDVNGSLTSPLIIVGSGTTFDVSAVSGGYQLSGIQTLSGSGVVTGAVTVALGGIINPGSNALTGTLSFSNSVTETGGAINHFDLSSNPLGANNDLVTIAADLNASGTNTVQISGSLTSGSTYTLFKYGGAFNGGITNFAAVGATGVLTNNTSTKTIAFIALATVRGPTNIVWIGNPANTNWDASVSTNWLNNGALDFFVPNDSVQFTDVGATNSPVNIVDTVTPASVLVNSASNYIFASTGGGLIGGLGGLTMTNTGTLTILTTNSYTGVTTIGGGTLVASYLAIGGQPSAIGAATVDPANIVIGNGTLSYQGPDLSLDRGITLSGANAALGVSVNGSLTMGGLLTGGGGLTKTDNGSLILPGGNSYNGGTFLNAGTLTLNNLTAAGSGTITLNGGNLVIGAVKPANAINVFASSSIAGGNAGGLTGIKNVIGNAPLGLSVTVGVFDLTGDMTAYSGNITFANAGGAVVRLNGSIGSALATWDLGAGPMDLNVRTGSTSNTIGALKGAAGTTLSGRGGSSNNGPTTHYIGANGLNTTFDGVIQNGSGGSSSSTAINKVGGGTLALSAANTYTGATTISSGVLALTGAGSIANSSSINVVSGATLDVSSLSTPTLYVGGTQTLQGRGTILGGVDSTGGLRIAPGGGVGGGLGTLTVTNAIALGGTTWMKVNRASSPNADELVSSLSMITYGGTLVVTNIGAGLQVGDTFTLFGGAGLGGGTFTTVVLPNYYSWNTNNLGVNGSVSVAAILPGPTISSIANDGVNVTIAAGNGAPNGPYTLLSSPNLALPVASWTIVTTGTFDGTGAINPPLTLPVDPAAAQLFYLLQAQ